MHEAERAVTKAGPVAVEELLIAGSRSAEGVGGGDLKMVVPRKHCGDDRQRAAQAVSGKKQRLLGSAASDRVFNLGLDRLGGLGEAFMKSFRRSSAAEVGDHILKLERIGAGKRDEGRAVSAGDDEASSWPKRSLNE